MARAVLYTVCEPGETDHISHNKLDNRKCNLRMCTRSQNRANSRSRKGSSSKYKGVSWNKVSKKWHATIGIGGKTLNLGTFDNQESAAIAYNSAALKYFGEYAYLNKVAS